jgi:hypothetical protein
MIWSAVKIPVAIALTAILLFGGFWVYRMWGEFQDLRAKADEPELVAKRDTGRVLDTARARSDVTLLPLIENVRRRAPAAARDPRTPAETRDVLTQCAALADQCARRRSLDSARIALLRDEVEILERRPRERHKRWSAQLGIGYGASLIADPDSGHVGTSPVLRARTNLDLFGPVSLDAQYRAQRVRLPGARGTRTFHSLDALLNWTF